MIPQILFHIKFKTPYESIPVYNFIAFTRLGNFSSEVEGFTQVHKANVKPSQMTRAESLDYLCFLSM